ncbi:helix-turn-helix transcriptional regulator [Streptomyces sp. NPDC056227]|uniref:helix-turn-helix transcriptional regulator n=1 Tax=Streptomyces sp. NPDC056227 TaxID=3345753 RepID=UPI0035E34A78
MRASDRVPARRRGIGDRVHAARRHAVLTQEELAGRAGLDRKTVNRLEQATHSPLLDHLLVGNKLPTRHTGG